MKDKPVLVIMAAGMGSRYGGLKQVEPVDEYGHLIIDYSIYDALQAGFETVVFIIKKEIGRSFKARIGDRISRQIRAEYVYQELADLPPGFPVPEGRKKPWGTGHAVLCCRGRLNAPFAVINSDDYYGRDAFRSIYNRLAGACDESRYQYSMVGYRLCNTLTENGYVSRGICSIGPDGRLLNIRERTRIEKHGCCAEYSDDDGMSWAKLPEDTVVSMNMWGFTPSILEELERRFTVFLKRRLPIDPLKCEYFLPFVVDELLREGKADVTVLESTERWYGITYKEDRAAVAEAIKELRDRGLYPEHLWGASCISKSHFSDHSDRFCMNKNT